MKKKPNVLIVDDEPFVRESLAEMLKSEGFGVFAASGVDEGVRLLADYFIDHYDSLQALAYHGVFEAEVDLEKAFAPKSAITWDSERVDELDQGLEIGDAIEMVRVRMSRSEVADSDWMETAWVLRHEFSDTFELLIIEIQDRLHRAAEAARMPVAESSEPGVPRLEDEDEESAI